MRDKTKILLFLIFFLALFLRIWQAGLNPTFISDEASIGYNAYSVLKTGKDEWGKFLPITFKSFGEYKLPLYIYLTAPSIFVFGLNELAVRFPSILFGSLTIIATYFMVRQLVNSDRFELPLLSSFLLAISPWHIQVSRMALEANLSLFIIVLAIFFFLKGLKEKSFFYPSFILLALSFYTYNACRVFVPLLIIGLVFIFRRKLKKNFRELILPLGLAFILLLPVVLTGFRGTGERVAKIGIFADPGIVMRINAQRVSCQNTPLKAYCHLVYNRPVVYTQVFLKNYLSHFSLKFLFLKGPGLDQYSVPGRGELYFFELPFLILGIFFLARSRKALLTLFLWLFLAPLANSFTGQAHPVRAIFLLPALQIFTAGGIVFCLEFLEKIKWAKLFFTGAFLAVAIVSLIGFLNDYFVFYPSRHTSTWQAGYKQLYPKLARFERDYEEIFVSKFYGEPHIFYLFYQGFNPKKYQEGIGVVRYDRPDSWTNVDRIGRYFFLQEVTPELVEKGSLLAAPPEEIFPGTEVLDKIYWSDGQVSFIIGKLR